MKTTTYDPNTDMVREVQTGPGFESISTYPRNNPGMRSMSTRSNNNSNNYVQYSGNQTPNVTFPPGFPFHDVQGSSSSLFNIGMGFPFGSGTGSRRLSNRNDLGQIFGMNDGHFEAMY